MAPKQCVAKRPAARAAASEQPSKITKLPVQSEEDLPATPGGSAAEDSYPFIQEASSGNTSCGKCGEPIMPGTPGAVKVGSGISFRCAKCNALLVRMWRRGLDVKRLDGLATDAKHEFFSKAREAKGKKLDEHFQALQVVPEQC